MKTMPPGVFQQRTSKTNALQQHWQNVFAREFSNSHSLLNWLIKFFSPNCLIVCQFNRLPCSRAMVARYRTYIAPPGKTQSRTKKLPWRRMVRYEGDFFRVGSWTKLNGEQLFHHYYSQWWGDHFCGRWKMFIAWFMLFRFQKTGASQTQ